MVILERTQDVMVLFPDELETIAFARMRTVCIAAGALTCAFYAVVAARIWLLLRGASLARKRVLLNIFGQIVMSIVAQVYVIFLLTSHMGWFACTWAAAALPTIYSISCLFNLRVLLLRALAVARYMSFSFQRVLQSLMFGSAGIFIVAFSAFLIYGGRLLFREGRCAEHVNKTIAIVLAISGASLATGLILIFVIPIWMQARDMATLSIRTGKTLRQVAWRNLTLTAFAQIFRLSVVIISVIMAPSDEADALQTQHLRLISWLGGTFDLFVSAMVSLILFQVILRPRGSKSRGGPTLNSQQSSAPVPAPG